MLDTGRTRAVIVVCDDNSLTPKSFYDACLLAQSASEGVDVIGNVPESVQKVAESQGFQSTNRFSFLGENNSSPQGKYPLLDEHPLDSDLLVVAIGNSAVLNMLQIKYCVLNILQAISAILNMFQYTHYIVQ